MAATQNKLANAATAWQNAMKSGQTKANYIAGVQAVTVSPMAKAATPEALDLYLRKVQDSVTSGRRAAALNKVSLQTWQQQASGVGATNLSTGATKGANKVIANFQQNAGVYMQASQAAAAIPKDGTISSAVAKVEASIRALKQGFGKPVA